MVSVIVPVYNVENILHYCIDSILKQTYSDFELILVDDGSTDKSGKICEKYAAKDTRIHVIHKENGGVSSARNCGIDNANGEYICFVDSDDYLELNYLEYLLGAKHQYPDSNNIWCGFYVVSDYEKTVIQTTIDVKDDVSVYSLNQFMVLYQKWLMQQPWNKLYYARLIKDNNIRFQEDLSLGEDILFNLDYLNIVNGKIFVTNKPFYNYMRSDKESLDNKFYHNLNDIYNRIFERLFYYGDKWKISKADYQIIMNARFYAFENVLRNTFHPKSDIQNKYQYNSRVLKSPEFKEVLESADCYIHPLYRFAYQHHSYLMVRALDTILKFKKANRNESN